MGHDFVIENKSRARRGQQLKMLQEWPRAYGGDLLKKQQARLSARPLSTRQTMHFVLRSTQAKGQWSFRLHKNEIRAITERFAYKFGVRLLSMANVGNHLHLHLQLTNRHAYKGFIRAIASAIMMRVTGVSRWNKIKFKNKFWDRRPFSSVVTGFRYFLNIRDYIKINQLQSVGYTKSQARFYISWNKSKKWSSA